MATNQGLLQVQIKVKNTIDLNNAFSSSSVANPQLKSIEGDINLSNEYALQSFNSSNTNIQHIDTIRTNSSNTSLKEALNNLPNLKYVRLEGSYESKGNSFDNNTNLQKVDLSESLQVKPEDFKANENLKTLPNLNYSNPDLTDIITNDTNLLPTTFDISNEPNTNKLGIHGDSTHQLGNLEFVKVNPEAPFDNQITPQINVSYTSLDRNGLVNLFNTMPYNVGYTVVGSPTIVDGIVSGFSESDYLTINSVPTVGTNDCEIGLCIITSGSIVNNRRIFGTSGGTNTASRITIQSNKLQANFSDGSQAYYVNSSVTLQTNTKYFCKWGRRNRTTLYIKVSTDNQNWIEDTAEISADIIILFLTKFWIGVSGYNQAPTNCSIDLKETYIKMNSQVSTGPVGYTVVGSPTITDGVASGLDNGRLTIDNFPFTSSNWEIGIKVGFNYLQSFQRLLTSSGKFYLRTSYSTWQLITNGSTAERIGDEGDANQYPFVKLVKNGSYISAYLSTDGITYKTGLENYSAGDATNGTLIISSQYYPWMGSVDLNSTYIKINGKLWFGHESKQVSWFSGKPSQIKVVDVSGAAGTSSLTNDDKAIVTNKGWTLVTE